LPPTTISPPPPLPGEEYGDTIYLENVNFTLLIPYFYDAKTVNIYSPADELLLSVDISQYTTGIIEGSVTDYNTNTVSNAFIQISGPGEDSAFSDANGNYQIVGLKPGSYTVNITPPLYTNLMSDRASVSVSAGEIITQNFSLNAAGSIAGKVTDDNGNPVANVHLYLSGYETPRFATDSDGKYIIPGLQDRTYTLNIESPGYGPWDIFVNDNYIKQGNSVTVDVTLGQTTWGDFTQDLNKPPVAKAGPDQTVERTSPEGAEVELDCSGSSDPDGDPITCEWTWGGGSASGMNPTVTLPPDLTTVTLIVSDGELFSDPDTCDITVVDTTSPTVNIVIPTINSALQDGVTLTSEAADVSGVASVHFYVREPGGTDGIPVGQEDLAGTLSSGTSESGQWEHSFDTTQIPDGYYVILAKAVDTYGNEAWSAVVPFSIRNWAVLELLPSSESNKAGRTMPVKFALRISASVDPSMPFVYNEDLEIRIFKTLNSGNILQTSHYGDSSRDYRINTDSELYITNYKTKKRPAEYTVEIWRINKNWEVGSFTFETVK
jgi:hypothetical protein